MKREMALLEIELTEALAGSARYTLIARLEFFETRGLESIQVFKSPLSSSSSSLSLYWKSLNLRTQQLHRRPQSGPAWEFLETKIPRM